MRDTIIWRGMVVFLSSSAIACTPGANVEQDSATGAGAPAAENRADTAAVAAPQATSGETADADTTAAKAPAMTPTTPAPGTTGSSRAADTVKERRGYDRAITPDFKDPRKRLPPAPDSTTDSTST